MEGVYNNPESIGTILQAVHSETGEEISLCRDAQETDAIQPFTPGVYEHYKSTAEDRKYYVAYGVFTAVASQDRMIVYEPLYGETKDLMARPAEMFSEEVTYEGRAMLRFRLIGKL